MSKNETNLYVKPGEYEQKYQEARDIINKIESGQDNLSESIQDYKKAGSLIKGLNKTISHFNTTIAKVETDNDQEVQYNRDKNGKDIKNDVKVPQSSSTSQTPKKATQTSSNTNKQTTNSANPKPQNLFNLNSGSNSGIRVPKSNFPF